METEQETDTTTLKDLTVEEVIWIFCGLHLIGHLLPDEYHKEVSELRQRLTTQALPDLEKKHGMKMDKDRYEFTGKFMNCGYANMMDLMDRCQEVAIDTTTSILTNVIGELVRDRIKAFPLGEGGGTDAELEAIQQTLRDRLENMGKKPEKDDEILH